MVFGAAFGGGFRGVFAGTTRQTLVLQPDATAGIDTYILSSTVANNNGISAQIISGNEAPITRYRGLLKFDLSAIPASARIISALVTLYCESEASTTDYAVRLHRSIVQWFEGAKNNAAPDGGQDGSVYNYRNANGSVAWAGGSGGASGSDWTAIATASTTITGVGSFTWDVTADVTAWMAGAANYGWWLINEDETGSTNSRKRFTSSDGATAGNRPMITIVYEV